MTRGTLGATGAESVGYMGVTTAVVSVVCLCGFCLPFGEEVVNSNNPTLKGGE